MEARQLRFCKLSLGALFGIVFFLDNVHANDGPLFPDPPYGLEDNALIAKSKPNALKLSVDDQILFLETLVEQFKSPSLQCRCLISMAAIYSKLHDKVREEAILIKAWSTYKTTNAGLRAGDLLMTFYKNNGDFAKASDVAVKILEKPQLSESQEVHFSCRCAENLSANGDPKKAFKMLDSIFSKHPNEGQRVAASMEEVSVTCMIHNDHKNYYQGFNRIASIAPKYANTGRFLGNYAHACQSVGKLSEAIDLRVRIRRDFPEDPRWLDNLFELARLLTDTGALATAAEYYEDLLAFKTSDPRITNLQKLASINLESIPKGQRGGMGNALLREGRWKRLALGGGCVFLLFAGAGGWWLRRKRPSK
jgi:tetratricopeptide (TPR) repeat protein